VKSQAKSFASYWIKLKAKAKKDWDRRISSDESSEMIKRAKTKLIVSGDRPIVAPATLAEMIGLERAVIIQQLHFLLRDKNNGKTIKGKRWIYNTYKQWQEHFPWMSLMSIRRRFREFEKDGWIESCQPEGVMSRRKYYRLALKQPGESDSDT
jgi:hypothetical protein